MTPSGLRFRAGLTAIIIPFSLVTAWPTVLRASSHSNPAPGLPAIPALPDVGYAVVRHAASGLALRGFDPVAFFASGKPVAGDVMFELQHHGNVWRFASEANRAAFIEEPGAYSPAFGGHDPNGIVLGRALEGSPAHFHIHEGQLLIFRDAASRVSFTMFPDTFAKATARWPEVERQLAR